MGWREIEQKRKNQEGKSWREIELERIGKTEDEINSIISSYNQTKQIQNAQSRYNKLKNTYGPLTEEDQDWYNDYTVSQVKKIAPSYTDLTSEKNIPITERTGQSSRIAREKQAEREAMRYTRPAPSLPQDQFEIDQTIPVSEHIAFDTKGQIQNKKYNLQVEGWRNQFESVNMLPDFRQMVERGKKRIATDQFKTGGFGDAAQYMNDPQTYTVLAAQSTGRATDPRRLAKMSDTEKETLLYFIGAGDDESAKKYFDDVVVRDLNRRYQTEANEKLRQFSNEHKVLGAGVNILSSVAQSGAFVETIRQAIENQITGQYKPVDPYSPRSEAANIVKYTTEGITQDMGLVGQTVTSSLLSLGQMGVLIPFGGPAMSAIMGLNAAGSSALEAAYRSEDPARALATSIASGLIEWGTEKLPIDNLFRIAKGGKSVSNSMVKEVLQQAGIEGTEELISEYANTLTDIALNGNRSAYNLRIEELIQSGMSRTEAEKQAQLDFFIIQPVMSFAGGGIAGGIGGGTAAGISVISDYQQSQSQNQPYLYPNDGQAAISDMNPALQQRIDELEIQSIEDLIAEQNQQTAPPAQQPQPPTQDMGESGQKAWAQISQNAAAEDAAEQFDRYYNAGKLGIPQNKIPENVSENPITPSQAAQAYFAGLNDAQTEQTATKAPQTEASFYEAGKNGASLESVFSSLGENADIPAKAAALQEWAAGRAEQNVSVKRNTTGQQTAKNNGGLVNNKPARTFSVQARNTLNQIGKELGVQIEFSDASGIGNGYYSNGKIVLSAQSENAVSDILKHELTHHFQQTAPQEYEVYSRYVIDAMAQADPEYLVSEMERTKNLYEAYTGENYSDQAVIDEIVADFTANFTDRPEELLQFAKENRSIAQRIADSLHKIIVKLRNALEKTFGVKRDLGQSERYNPYGLALEQFEQAEALWREALRGSRELVVKKGSASYGASKKDPSIKSAEPLFDNTISQKSSDVNTNIRKNGGNDTKQYSLNAGFAQELDQWLADRTPDGKLKTGGYFKIGTTSDALKSIGVDDYKIYWNKSKIAKIMKEHPEMTADVIKKVPDILEHPILVMQSQTVTNRITLFGETMDVGGNPVLAAIELRPQNKSGEVMDFAVIASAYGKRGIQNLIDTSDILYLDPNKKRTNTWLEALRLQLPAGLTKYGSIANITYVNRNVKGEISFGSEESESAMEAAFRKAIQESEAKHSSHSSIRKNGGNDTDFSISSLERENARLKERLNHFKGQLKRTKKITFEEKTVNRIARDKLKEYDSGADVPSVAGKIQTLYEYIANGDGKEHNVSWTEVKSQLNEIAAEIAENARILDDTLYQQYAPLRKQLQGNTYYFDPQSRADLETAGGYDAIRKHNMGRFFLSADPGKTGIDTLYDELNAQFGSTLFPEEITNPADQLIRISQVLDDLQPIVENPYSADMQMVIEHIGNEILEQFFETPQVKPTFADRQAQKLDETNRRWRQKYDQAIIKERTKREEKLAALRQKYQSKDAKARERREAGDLRAKIERHVSKLSQKLLRPTDKQHIPEPLRQAVADMLQSINLESSFVIDPETGKRVKQGTAKAETIDNPEPVKRTEAFSELRRQYEEIAKENSGYNLVLDPNLLENLQKVADMKQIRIADMNTEQLTTIWNTVKAVEASISTENRTLSDLKYKSTSEMANRLHEDLADRHMRRNFRSGVLNRIDGAINLDMLSPETYFHRMGEVGDELFRAMRRAEDQQTRILAEATDYTQEVLKKFSGKTKTREIGKTVRDLERETHSFQMEGGNIELSTAQIMELYNLSKRDQSLDHIYVGGIRPDANTGKGIFEQRKARPVKVTPQDVQRIINSLTDSQRKLADQMMEFLSGRMAEYGNRASVDVYGYEKFKEPNYWPIKADENQTRSEVGQNEVKAVPNYGMTQATNPNASNAVMIGSVFDTYTQHISEMATYSAWLKTWYDVDRLRNYTSWQKNEGQDKMGRAWTVPELIEQLYGKNGNKYWLKLMEDIAKGTKAKADTVFSMDKITANYKAASVGANIRVILQQPTSYLRASTVMDWKYLSKAMFTGKGWEKAKQYAPIAQWKDWGYFDISTGRNVKDIITGSDSALEWARQKSMTLASKADSFTWGRIWNACELETADTRPDLTRGSEAFYEAAGERFAEIIDRTQVVDSVMQRTQVMRSENALNRMATSFMSEPSKVYNMAIRALYDFKDAKGEEKKKAGKALARTVFSLIVSFAANSVAQSIVDAWREDELEKKYGERFVDAWAENFTSNFNPLSYIPYARDLVSVAQGYDVARMDMEPFAKLFKTAETAFKSIQGEGKYSTAAAMANLFAEGGRLLGLPVANIKRDVEGILTAASYELDQYMMQYQILSLTRNLNNDANKSTVYGLLYDAKQKDMAAYNKIKEDLVSKYGYDPDDLEEAVEKVPYNRAKKEERFQREVKQKQKEAQTSLENSSYFRRMTAQEQKSAISQLEKWASDTVKEKNKVGEMERKWRRQKESGVSLNQYVIYNTFEGDKEEKIQRSMEVFRMSEEEATELYYKIQSYLYAGDTLNDSQEKNLAEAKEAGFTEAQFRKAYNALRGVEGTKLRSGRTVEGSRKRNMLKALREAGFTSAQANKLYQILQGRSED